MNLRVVLAGILLIILAAEFFLSMETLIPGSNDPVEMRRTAGMISGGGAGLGAVMLALGLFRGKRSSRL
ncbi:MAG TPA: hypothetical protein VGG57_02630 [Stellaceae bacterium]|jgi:hypothetical protein